MKTETYIVEYKRTPIGKFGGSLSSFRPDDLAAKVIRSVLDNQPKMDEYLIDDIILGCANQAGEDNRNIARFASLLAGLPVTVPGVTVNRLCASGMQAITDAYSRIHSGIADVIIAGGVESMSRAPYVMAKSNKPFDRSLEIFDTTLGWRFINPAFNKTYKTLSMGETAENISKKWNISRDAQDEFSYNSHVKYINAYNDGKYKNELINIFENVESNLIDENPRKDTSLQKLANLKTVFLSNGTVTAGNSSGLNDGAAAMMITSSSAVAKYNLKPIAKIISASVVGVDPDFMGIGPIPAIIKLLKQVNLSIDDIDLFEINEAYAVQVLHCINELKIDSSKVNINGGAVAIGHPLGCSGTRIVGHLALELQRSKKRFGIASMCVGVGQGTAILIENINL